MSIFTPLINKIYIIENHSLFIMTDGEGRFQVDFKTYSFTSNKLIFLEPGQYFQLLTGLITIQLYEFPIQKINDQQNSRFLFKHLVSLGQIDLNQPKEHFLKELQQMDLSGNNIVLLTNSINNWIALNPFNGTNEDVNLLFDLKEIIDAKFREPISMVEISSTLHYKPAKVIQITREKLNYSINKLKSQKLLLEAQRKVVFSDFSTKEIAYDLGFNDPAYFNRFFKLETQKTPSEFRQDFAYDERDSFVNDLNLLINQYYKKEHFADFFANQLYMSTKTLTRKVNQKMQTSLNDLIKEKRIGEAKKLLNQKNSITDVAYELGFKEPNHFSMFFKNYTGNTPSQFIALS